MDKYDKTILVAIAIQKLGQATLEEIEEKIKETIKKEKLDVTITSKAIDRECKKLQKKNLISTNYINDKGSHILAYSPSNPIFSRGIEGMQFMDIVDSEREGFIKQLDTKKGANKGRLPDIRDYYRVKVKWSVIDDIGLLGFMPRTKEGYLEHYRDSKGKIIFLPKHFRAYIRSNQRTADKTSLHQYIRFDIGKVTLNGAPLQKTGHFVLDGNQGRGNVTHEVIPKGATVETQFGVPRQGGLDEKQFEAFLRDIAEFPIRGLSGASSQGFGKLKLEKFELL